MKQLLSVYFLIAWYYDVYKSKLMRVMASWRIPEYYKKKRKKKRNEGKN